MSHSTPLTHSLLGLYTEALVAAPQPLGSYSSLDLNTPSRSIASEALERLYSCYRAAPNKRKARLAVLLPT